MTAGFAAYRGCDAMEIQSMSAPTELAKVTGTAIRSPWPSPAGGHAEAAVPKYECSAIRPEHTQVYRRVYVAMSAVQKENRTG